ncbi:MAG: glucosamine inositolphosphorylceramide transferase family protein [Bacteroidia bacterium]
MKAIKELIASGHAEISLLIIDERNTQHKKISFLNKVFKKHSIYNFFYNRLVKPDALKEIDIAGKLNDVKIIYCSPEKISHFEEFSNKDVEKIKSNNLDFIIRFGFNIIRGEILNAAGMGVWSYHHGDEMKYRGGPPAFWEIYDDEPVTGVILQRLTNKLDAGIILKKGYYKTVNHSYKETLNTILIDSSSWIAQVCREIIIKGKENSNWKTSETKAKVFTFPSNTLSILFLFKLFVNKIRFHIKNLFQVEQWNFGIVKQPVKDFIENGLKNELISYPLNTKKYFAADAFGFIQNEKINICFEKYEYKQSKAEIHSTTFDCESKTFSESETIISSSYHLAYPYIIEQDGDIYCLPENNIRANYIFKLKGKNVWEKASIDFPENDLIDCTIFFHGDYYWLFCTRKTEGSNLKLFIYYSDNLKGPYLTHLLNPVKTDISSARPAGTPFIVNGELFRPSQDSSETYGGRIKINKVTSLSPDSFSEITIKIIEPFDKSFNKGIHTFAVIDDYILLDSKKYIFSLDHFIKNLKGMFRKA